MGGIIGWLFWMDSAFAYGYDDRLVNENNNDIQLLEIGAVNPCLN